MTDMGISVIKQRILDSAIKLPDEDMNFAELAAWIKGCKNGIDIALAILDEFKEQR